MTRGVFLFTSVVVVLGLTTFVNASTDAPTPSPEQGEACIAYFGDYCTDECKCIGGSCLGPHIYISGIHHGTCAPPKVGTGCVRACIHDPEGGTPCKNFPGECLKCRRGRPRRGVCGKKKM